MAIFPRNKSYFRCKQEGLEVLARDDKEYLVISDSNKVENEGQLLFCCLRTSNKYRRDKCGGAPRRLLNSVDFRGFQRFSTSATCDQNRGIIAGFLQLDMHYSELFIHVHTSLNNRLFIACLCVLLLLYNYTWFLHALVLSFVIALYLHMRLLIACLLGIRETFLQGLFFQLRFAPLYVFGKRCKEIERS